MARVGLVAHPSSLQHDTGPHHPERPERVRAILEQLRSSTAWSRLRPLEARAASRDTLLMVHPAAYIDDIQQACQQAPRALDPDTLVSPGSWDAALHAAGSVITAIDAVMDAEVSSAFCAVRPPGHHALSRRAMGFCLFNNVAIGARYAQRRHALSRVLIVDWDVHHGNGTQAIFNEDPSVFYFSTHQHPFYPGTGAASEVGRGQGIGATLNVPLPAGSGDAEALAAIDTQLAPAARQFHPELILISAGFDAHRDDPLAQLEWTAEGYAALTRRVKALAEELCQGRIVSALEGGYDLSALSQSVEAHLRALAS